MLFPNFLQAVKLRQSIYGEDNPITKRTLDLFTVIYAEMGKEQYTGRKNDPSVKTVVSLDVLERRLRSHPKNSTLML